MSLVERLRKEAQEWDECGSPFRAAGEIAALCREAADALSARTEARENEWLEDELMEVMRIVAKGMNPDLPEEDEIIYAMMVTAIRRLMEADTDRYEALLERWQKRHASVSPQQRKEGE